MGAGKGAGGGGRGAGSHPTQCGSLRNLTLEMLQGGGFCLTRAIQLPYYVIPWYFAHFEILPVLTFGGSVRQLCRVLGKLRCEGERISAICFPVAYEQGSSVSCAL